VSDSLVSLVTALADDELILGHRHSEWTGFAPHLEEDVAFSSIAQDEIGHASACYALAASVTGDDADRLALGREKSEYHNAVICERANRDWAYTLARHWLYDHADEVRLEALSDSASSDLAALVEKMRREERYHLIHADLWIKRVTRGPVEGRTKLVDAIAQAWPEALDVFEPIELEDEAVKEGWLPTPSSELRQRFVARATAALDELRLPTHIDSHATDGAEFVASSSGDLIASEDSGDRSETGERKGGGRRGRRSEDFDALWEDMTAMFRTDPAASW
jgi:ring-1,2-phenylacetyl-CoA epoxidase subunit PaaC